ncbi:MAG: asparaginase [Chloroflexota bacterium]
MSRPRLAIVFTGGTISMLLDPATGAAVPALSGAAILARSPGLAAIADLVPVDWGLIPASHLSFAQILDIAATVRTQLADPAVDAAIVVQGTDVIEETAFALDLLIGGPKPVVVVGAMRNAADPGYEGPANLRDAVLAAADPRLRDQGTVVVMGGLVLPADDVTKTHTHAYDTFQARNLGPLGSASGSGVVIGRRRTGRRLIEPVPAAATEPIALVTATVASDGAPLRWAVAGGARGIVVAATGAGNTHFDLLAAAEEAMAAGIPVVLASRVPSGRVSPDYGFPGGGARWIAAGAIPAGFLTPVKARIALAYGLGAGLDDPGLRALFADPG